MSDYISYVSIADVAKLLTELFGDDCACNYNGIDEWLPFVCPDAEEACPNKCWEHYIRAKLREME